MLILVLQSSQRHYLCRLFLTRKRILKSFDLNIHAASLRQAFAHCGIFLAAASRRSLDRISVPMCPITLSGRIPVIALVGRYPANKLMGRRPLLRRSREAAFLGGFQDHRPYSVLPGISTGYPQPKGTSPTCYSPVRHSHR